MTKKTCRDNKKFLPHFVNLRKRDGGLLGEADELGAVVSADSGEREAVAFRAVRAGGLLAEEKLMEVLETERRRQRLRKVQPFTRATDFRKAVIRCGKFSAFVRSRGLEVARARHCGPIRGDVVVLADVVRAVTLENLSGAH